MSAQIDAGPASWADDVVVTATVVVVVANGALPSDDDGLVELPSDDCDDGGAWSSHQAKEAPTPAKAARHPHRAKAPPTHAQMTEWSQNPNARKRQRIPEQMRKGLGEPRGDQPRDVIPGRSAGGPRGDHPGDVIPGPSAGDSLAVGNIDLPEEVANDELDDLLVDDVSTRRSGSDWEVELRSGRCWRRFVVAGLTRATQPPLAMLSGHLAFLRR